jgi:hypothetical protein
MFWAFTSGVAKTLREEMQREELAEDERLEWERRLQFQQKIQEEAEKRRKASEEIFREYDPKSGKFVSMSRDGGRAEYDAPEGYKEEYERKKKQEQEDREMDINFKKADDRRADAQLANSQAYASMNREQFEYNKGRDRIEDMAKLSASGLGYGAGGGVFPTPTGGVATPTSMQGTIESVYKRLTTGQDVNQELAAEAAAIYASAAPPDQKLQALRQLETKRFPAQGGGTPEPKTQAEYDALPSGTIYMEDGKKYRKP